MYFLNFDGDQLSTPYDNFDDAKRIIESSERLNTGFVSDIHGNVLFSVDRGKASEKTIFAKYLE